MTAGAVWILYEAQDVWLTCQQSDVDYRPRCEYRHTGVFQLFAQTSWYVGFVCLTGFTWEFEMLPDVTQVMGSHHLP